MALFREKVSVEAAMRLILNAAVKRDPTRVLSEISKAGVLTGSEMEAVRENLPGLEAALWQQIFLEHAANRLTAEELSFRFMISLGLALRDTGIPENQLADRLESPRDSITNYLEYLQTVPSSDLASKGSFFFLCEHFTDLVMGGANLRDECVLMRRFQVFEIAKQSYQAVRQAFASLTKECKIVFK
ncbi:MAG: hypothetical protein WBF13_00110 [Candidatus Zixiibacteriota bacterium]